jgi:hypothetical protein
MILEFTATCLLNILIASPDIGNQIGRLKIPQPLVDSIFEPYQQIMAAFFDDMAIFHNDNPIHLANGRKPMRDSHHRAANEKLGERILNVHLGF